MKKESKNTKRALAASVGCVALCTAMLVGTTYAWFTDTASTSVSKIESGNLGIQILDMGNNVLDENSELKFVNNKGEDGILWEPGASFKTRGFKLKNVGNLALKYKFEIKGIDGNEELLKAIDFSVVYNDIDGNEHAIDLSEYDGDLDTKDKESGVYYIKGTMKQTAGNEYQGMELTGIKLNVLATQNTVEWDSYRYDYDKDAQYATPVSTADDLKTAIEQGKDVVLENDIKLTNSSVSGSENYQSLLDLKQSATIYGDGEHKLILENTNNSWDRVISIESETTNNPLTDITLTLSGVDIVGPTGGSYNRGITAWGVNNLTIVMDNCTASAEHYALNIAAENTNVNVVIRNSTLTGYRAFQTFSVGTKATFENCTLIGKNTYASEKGINDCYTIGICGDYPNFANDSELTFKNCRIEANESEDEGHATQGFFTVQTGVAGAKATFEGCEFFYNGDAVTEKADILSHMNWQEDSIITIK